jgi:DNA invertase Pin-like site-specific DNA recombinase
VLDTVGIDRRLPNHEPALTWKPCSLNSSTVIPQGDRSWLIYRDVASGGSLDRQGWSALMDLVRPGDTITVSHLDRIGRNLVEELQVIERLTELGVGIVALDAGIDTSANNPAARLQTAMMLAFAEWERQTVRERSIGGQLRAREAGKMIGRPEALTESAKADIRLLHQQGRSATRLAEDYRVARSTIYKAIGDGETRG